jgi:hypothetical protein
MPEIVADPPDASCYHLFPGSRIQEFQLLAPDPFSSRGRDARGRFAKGNSGNPRGRPRGIRNPRRRVPDLAARRPSAQALSDLLDRKPHLLGPLAAQLLPPPLPPTDPATHLGIDLSSLRRWRMSGRCCPRFWQRLRAARSRPPRARASRGGCVPGCAPSRTLSA